MGSKPRRWVLLSGFMVFIFSCVTVNIYFPEAEVQKTAEEIVDEVRKDDTEKKEKKDSGEMKLAAVFSLVPAAYAQDPTTVTNPKIRAIQRSLTDRFPRLRPFFVEKRIGEGNDGLVKIRDEDGLPMQRLARMRKLVNEENSDREDLYRAVAVALDIDPSQLQRVQKIFAENWIRKARPGWWIQTPEGKWIQKPGA